MPTPVLMPALSPTMTEGTLARWHKAEGDEVAAGDVLAEIETDKATMEVEAVDEGRVGAILIAEGTEGVAVNTPIAVLLGDGEDAESLKGFDAGVRAPAAPPPAVAPQPPVAPVPAPAAPVPVAAAPAQPPAGAAGGRIFASPLARRLAREAGLDLAVVTGSGPHGRIVRADVEAAAASGAGAASPAAAAAAAIPGAAPFALEKPSTMRRTIARRLSESKQTVPHFYLTVDVGLDAALALRRQVNEHADGDVKISVNDLVLKAVAAALGRVPAANASWSDEGIRYYRRADISVAVAIDGGLITPVIRDAGAKSLGTISAEMKQLAARARAGRLLPEEYHGGTFSVSNLGMYGVREFAAVINPPEGCILAVGAGERRPVVRDGELVAATVMTVTLSVDHRVVDGAVGAEFLAAFRTLMENPVTMLV